MDENTEQQERKSEAQRWRVIRDLGMLTIAAAAAVYTVAIVVQAKQRESKALAIESAPPPPVLTAPEPQSPQGVTIYNSGKEAYSVTIGTANGVTELTHRGLGDTYYKGVEFMRLLRVRDPELYAWAKLERFKNEAAEVDEHNANRTKYEPRQKIVGVTDDGHAVKQGETVMVPDGPPRTKAEIEADYEIYYRITAEAYGDELLREHKTDEFEVHLKKRFPQQQSYRVHGPGG